MGCLTHGRGICSQYSLYHVALIALNSLRVMMDVPAGVINGRVLLSEMPERHAVRRCGAARIKFCSVGTTPPDVSWLTHDGVNRQMLCLEGHMVTHFVTGGGSSARQPINDSSVRARSCISNQMPRLEGRGDHQCGRAVRCTLTSLLHRHR
jgi:hypothetical protein